MKRTIYTIDALKEIWSLLGLFESKKYVCDKLRNRYSNSTTEQLELRTEQIIYSVRQAREFFNSADEVSLLTSPLLLSYGMLNLAKALVLYLCDEGTNFKDYFKQHGLTVPFNHKEQSLGNEHVKFMNFGTYSQMTSIYSEPSFSNLQISIKELISQIPDLREMYLHTYNEHPRVTPLSKIEYGYLMKDLGEDFSTVWQQILEMHEIYQGTGYRVEGGHQSIAIMKTVAANNTLEELGLVFKSLSGVEYFRTIPKLQDKVINLKEASIHYLIIFSYGMLARYHATRWGKYIDPNISSEAQIINKSIFVCKNRFLHLMVNYLFQEDVEFKISIEQLEKSRREMADYVYDDVMKKMTRDLQREMRVRGF